MQRVCLILAGGMLALVTVAVADPFITKQNQASNHCNLVVDVRGLPDWRQFTVVIPRDNSRPMGITKVSLVIGANGSPTNCRAMAPLHVQQRQDGSRVVEAHVGRDLLKDAFFVSTTMRARLRLHNGWTSSWSRMFPTTETTTERTKRWRVLASVRNPQRGRLQ